MSNFYQAINHRLRWRARTNGVIAFEYSFIFFLLRSNVPSIFLLFFILVEGEIEKRNQSNTDWIMKRRRTTEGKNGNEGEFCNENRISAVSLLHPSICIRILCFLFFSLAYVNHEFLMAVARNPRNKGVPVNPVFTSIYKRNCITRHRHSFVAPETNDCVQMLLDAHDVSHGFDLPVDHRSARVSSSFPDVKLISCRFGWNRWNDNRRSFWFENL